MSATPPSLRSSLAALLLAAPLLGGATCSSRPDSKAREQAAIHYDLGVQAMRTCDARAALKEYQRAVELDPQLDLAHNALALTYHLSFGDVDSAIRHYQEALELNPKFSEAYTNLANAYLAQGRYDEAIPLYEKALGDMLYKTPFIAENNLGWCYYKKGEVQRGIDHIRSAIIANAQFCLGYRNLGIIYGELGEPQKSADNFAQFVKHCPDSADAHFRYGAALLKLQDTEGSRRELQACVERSREPEPKESEERGCRKAQELSIAEDCQRYLRLLEQQ
ncbi:MAG: social motility TPR repeat lipoprotein Tgl [Myxococcales bacterium]|jgi:type IV pilus assembly protein PilF